MSLPHLRIAGDTARPLPRKMRLTQRMVADATCPPGKGFASFYDTEAPRLVLLVTAGGSKTWYVYQKENGRPIRWKLGSAEALPVDVARRRCREALATPGGLTALLQTRTHAKAVGTMQELFDEWRADGAGKKKSADQDKANWDRYCGRIAGRPVVHVTTAELAALHRRIGTGQMPGKAKGGPFAANRVLALLRTMFAWAISRKLVKSDPADGIKPYEETERERFLLPEEIPAFLEAVESEPSPTLKDVFKMLLATGARRGNVQAMRWADVDLTNNLWRLPAKSNKSGRFVVVPLMPDAVEILERRQQNLESEEWVFPANSRSGHVEFIYAAWEKLVERAGLKDLRPHDIRRTVGATLAMNNASDRIISGVLGQTTTHATGVYARLRTQPLRDAMQAAQTIIAEQAKAPKEGKPKQKK